MSAERSLVREGTGLELESAIGHVNNNSLRGGRDMTDITYYMSNYFFDEQ